MRRITLRAGRRARILIVDDERDNRELLELILRHDGFVVVSVGSGEEALASMAAEPADLVLLDIMMPGMNGYEVAAHLRRNPANETIPIIMMSALSDRSARALAVSAGADGFFTKPMGRADLCARVRKHLTASLVVVS